MTNFIMEQEHDTPNNIILNLDNIVAVSYINNINTVFMSSPSQREFRQLARSAYGIKKSYSEFISFLKPKVKKWVIVNDYEDNNEIFLVKKYIIGFSKFGDYDCGCVVVLDGCHKFYIKNSFEDIRDILIGK